MSVYGYASFGVEGGMWDLTVLVSDHCLSFYFTGHAVLERLSACVSTSV